MASLGLRESPQLNRPNVITTSYLERALPQFFRESREGVLDGEVRVRGEGEASNGVHHLQQAVVL